jgi:hypothetical protein
MKASFDNDYVSVTYNRYEAALRNISEFFIWKYKSRAMRARSSLIIGSNSGNQIFEKKCAVIRVTRMELGVQKLAEWSFLFSSLVR